MRKTWPILALGAVAAVAAGAGAWAQSEVTFRSLQITGIKAEVRAAGGAVRPAAGDDRQVRFYTTDGRRYELEGFGCRFQYAPLRDPLTPEDSKVVEMVDADVAAYRAAANQALAADGGMHPVAVGELVMLGPARTAGEETYGLACSDQVVTAVALDVARILGGRKLRLLLLQTGEGLTADRSSTLASVVMENVVFIPRTDADLSRTSPLTSDLFKALTQ